MSAVSINVNPEQARAANLIARSSSAVPEPASAIPAATCAPPGLFTFMTASVAVKRTSTGAAAKSLELRMSEADNKSDEAVCAYDEMNLQNRQSLELI